MAQSKKRKHGSGKKPTPHMDKLALRESLREKLTDDELQELEREIRASIKHGLEEVQERTMQESYVRHWAVTMRVLRDRFGWGKERILRLWNLCIEYLEDIQDGRITAQEMLNVLEREDGITISMDIGGKYDADQNS